MNEEVVGVKFGEEGLSLIGDRFNRIDPYSVRLGGRGTLICFFWGTFRGFQVQDLVSCAIPALRYLDTLQKKNRIL